MIAPFHERKGLLGIGICLCLLSGLVGAAVLFGGASGCSRNKKLNLLLLTLDTTRADHLRCYGYDWIETPNLNRLAKEGVLFENAFSHIPLTLPAHTAIMTSTVPLQNGVIDNGAYRVPDELVTMAEILSEEGYQTAAFISAAVLQKVFNLNQGFQHWDEEDITPQEERSTLVADRKGNLTTDAALKWLSSHYQKPFFIWVHYYDPHAAYDPPEPYKSMYPNPYDGEISFMDSQAGRLIEFLKKHGLYEKTLIIAIGDHGEGLEEHGEPTHAYFIYQATVHVPFIMRIPGFTPPPGGKRIKTLAQQVDVLPTVLDYLGIKPRSKMTGMSLRPVIELDQDPETPRFAYMESKFALLHYGWAPLSGISDGRFKFIKAPKPELYDLQEDPHELKNLIADGCTAQSSASDPCKTANLLKAKLTSLEAEWSRDQLKSQEAEISPAQAKQLQALGYVVGGFKGNPELAMKKDPKDYVDLLRPLMLQQSARRNHDFQQLYRVCKFILGRDPENTMALENYADALFALGKYEEAIETRKKFVEIHGDDARQLREIGLIYIRMSQTAAHKGDQDQARKYMELAIDSLSQSVKEKDDNPIAHYYLGRLLLEKGELEEAMAHFQKPKLAGSYLGHLGMALYYERIGRPALAEVEFSEAEKQAGEKGVVFWQEYAQFLIRSGKEKKALELLEKALEKDETLEKEPLFMETLNQLRERHKEEKKEQE